jgi:hypothetical protein
MNWVTYGKGVKRDQVFDIFEMVLAYNSEEHKYEHIKSERPRSQYPYSYSSHISWYSSEALTRGIVREDLRPDGTIYSDRLLQQDWDKHNELCMKHFGDEGQYWNMRDPKKVEAFLRDWCNDPKLHLCHIREDCNQSSGYPLWCFDFKRGK